LRIGQAESGALGNGRVSGQRGLDLGRVDVLSPPEMIRSLARPTMV